MYRRLCFVLAVIACLGSWHSARAEDDLTLSLVPIGGNEVNGHQSVQVEVFATASRAIRLEGGIVDFPCEVMAGSGGAGTLTWTGATVHGNGDEGQCVSSGGIPYLFTNQFGGCGLFAINNVNPPTCKVAMTPSIGAPPVDLPAGVTRYLGTHTFLVSDCAAGDFEFNMECTDQPGGHCDNVPESTNSTYFREDAPPGPVPGPHVSLVLPGTTLTASMSPCCIDGLFGPPANTYCCAAVQGGCADYRLVGDGCAPAVYGDAYPPEPLGNGWVDMDDILLVLIGFIEGPGNPPAGDVWPCGGPDGVIDVDDIFGVLGAFVGEPPCSDPCE